MNKPKDPIACYIAAYRIPNLDPYLRQNGFHAGMILFAIPDYGIQFRCRAEGEMIDLEFGAFFALVKFIEKNLGAEKISAIRVHSSNPEFIFAFTGNSKHMPPDSERFKLVRQQNRKISTTIGYLPPEKNKAFISVADYPSIPSHHKIQLAHESRINRKASFKPWQKGIQL
ncbi:MAG: hypothetical protein P1R58_10390 [bacterium]|nr:hypothetical protein [bacterium]